MPKKQSQPDIQPAAEPKAINAASKRCIAVLTAEYQQNLEALVREAAEIDGVALDAGYKLDLDQFVWHKPDADN